MTLFLPSGQLSRKLHFICTPYSPLAMYLHIHRRWALRFGGWGSAVLPPTADSRPSLSGLCSTPNISPLVFFYFPPRGAAQAALLLLMNASWALWFCQRPTSLSHSPFNRLFHDLSLATFRPAIHTVAHTHNQWFMLVVLRTSSWKA